MKSHRYSPPQQPLQILHIDQYLVVINKPSGLLSVPGRAGEHRDSLATRVQALYPEALTVHRLDMDTSGVVVMALDKDTHRQLSRLFQERQTDKCYYAWVWGEVEGNNGEVDLPLICDWPNRPLQKVDHQQGKPSLTRWQRIRVECGNTLLKLLPHTGRSHQLRVHMQAIGHPILGDVFYAHLEAQQAAGQLQLHASALGFTHPATGEQVNYSAEVPFPL